MGLDNSAVVGSSGFNTMTVRTLNSRLHKATNRLTIAWNVVYSAADEQSTRI